MTPPVSVPPGQAPGGIVFNSYADPGGRLLTSSPLRPQACRETIDTAIRDRQRAEALLRPSERIVLVAYDGDTGERDAEFDHLVQMVLAGPDSGN